MLSFNNCDKISNQDLKIERNKKEILFDLIYDCVLNDSMPKPLNERIKNVIDYWNANHSLKKLSHKLPDCSNYTPLGISLKPQRLNINEKQVMRRELEKHILETYPDLLKKLNSITNNELNNRLNTLKCDDDNLSPEQEKVINLCEKYHKILEELHQTNIEMCQAMKEWIDLRLGVMITTINQKSELCKYKSKLVELKTKLISIQLKRFVYGGKTAIRDYMDYYLSMKEKLEKHKNEIDNYKKLLNIDDD